MNESRRQHPTKQQLYGHLPPITKTIQVRRTRHAEHCWRNKDELIIDILWTFSYERAKARRLPWTYIQQLCADTGCSSKDLLGAIDDRDGWRERVREISAGSATWWWWWQTIRLQFLYTIYMYKPDLALTNLQGLICHKIQTNKRENKLRQLNNNMFYCLSNFNRMNTRMTSRYKVVHRECMLRNVLIVDNFLSQVAKISCILILYKIWSFLWIITCFRNVLFYAVMFNATWGCWGRKASVFRRTRGWFVQSIVALSKTLFLSYTLILNRVWLCPLVAIKRTICQKRKLKTWPIKWNAVSSKQR